MDVQDILITDRTMFNLRQLQLKVELHENTRYRINRSLQELVSLLKHAYQSSNQPITVAYALFFEQLELGEYYFFSILKVKKGADKQPIENNTTQGHAPTPQNERKKIVYRGRTQVT